MGAINDALMHRGLQLGSLYHRADVQIVDLQRATRHLVDAVHIIFRELLEDTATPGTLKFKHGGLVSRRCQSSGIRQQPYRQRRRYRPSETYDALLTASAFSTPPVLSIFFSISFNNLSSN